MRPLSHTSAELAEPAFASERTLLVKEETVEHPSSPGHREDARWCD